MSNAALVNGVFGVMGAALTAISAMNFRTGGRRRSPSRMAVAAAAGTMGVSFLLQSPAARAVQDDVLVNLGQLTGNGTTLVAAYCLQLMVLLILYERRAATARALSWLVALLTALACMTVLFLATSAAPSRFTSPDPPAGIVAYYLVFTGYLGCTVTSLFLLLRRYSNATSDRWLRISLRLYRWACAVGAVYLAGRIATLTLGRLGVDVDGERFGLIEFLLAAVVPAVCFALCLAAATIKAVGRWLRYRRTDRRLRPLWEAARVARPHAVLPVMSRGRVRLRLYRRVIEIQDAQLAAADMVDATQRQSIEDAIADAALTGEAAEAVRDAAVLAAGLAALRSGRAPIPHDAPATSTRREGTPDFAAVLDRLERTSAAWTRSPIVHRFSATR